MVPRDLMNIHNVIYEIQDFQNLLGEWVGGRLLWEITTFCGSIWQAGFSARLKIQDVAKFGNIPSRFTMHRERHVL